MNTNFLFKGLALLGLGAFLTGCSSDEIVPDTLKTVNRDSRFYINVSIAAPDANSTRADETTDYGYNTGTKAEQEINSVLFVFYDALNNYVAHATRTGSDFTKVENNTSGSVETELTLILPVDVQEGQGVPQYVMAYVNPSSGANLSTDNDVVTNLSDVLVLGRSLEQVIPFTSSDISKYNESNEKVDYIGEALVQHKGFTMTNSVYYASSEDNMPNVAVKLPDGALFESEEAANAKDAPCLVIYVERVVAKVSVKMAENLTEKNNTATSQKDESDDATTADTYELKFEPLAWGVNNVEKGTFLIKNFRSGSNNYIFSSSAANTPALTNLLYSSANTALSALNGWNSPTDYRSFWAYSPTYFPGSSYPEFSDEYSDSEDSYPLHYKSYNDFYDTTSGTIGHMGQELGDDPLYSLEQTTQAAVLRQAGEPAITSATIVGKYSVYKEGSTEALPEGNFYLIRETDKNVLYASDEIMTKAFLKQNHAIYVVNDEDKEDDDAEGETSYSEGDTSYRLLSSDDYESCKSHFTIRHPSKKITGVYTSSRYVSLQMLGDGATAGKYYYKDINGRFVKITDDDTRTTANTNLYSCLAEHFSAVEMFNSGMAYFSVPIKHLWKPKSSSTDDDSNSTDANDKFSAYPGQYGIVRNHVYSIDVEGIDGIGMGISDPDDPIIIPVKKKEYYVKTQIRAQRWRLVPTQTVTLSPR